MEYEIIDCVLNKVLKALQKAACPKGKNLYNPIALTSVFFF